MAKPNTKRASLALPFILTFASSACSKSPVGETQEKHGEDPVEHGNPPPPPIPAPVKAAGIDAAVSPKDEATVNSDAPLDAGAPLLDAGLVLLELHRLPPPTNKNPPRVPRKPRQKPQIRRNPPSPRSDSSPIAKPKTNE